ncbi:uncharacterized protein LOC113138704 [Mastacembelus armatus]|uniref:Zgc:162608 n=1 Tax=Mastacembelus armatus TaxID=205130 RepID=A0A3Q3LLX5_9TELE|nr:uncharacterized protein LOC113138704 [Mastacembelus armatus]
MYLKVMIFTVSFLTTSAIPLHSNSREANWTDPKSNQAHDKTELTKDVGKSYKSHIDSSGLYSHEDDEIQNPVAEEMQRKVNMESERLRARLRQELTELWQRLSPSPGHLSSIQASMRERLAPLTQQLQSSLSSNTKELCGQLRLYLQGLEIAEAQAEGSPDLYKETFHWMSQTLEHISSKQAAIIGDFHTRAIGVIKDINEIRASEEEAAKSELWQNMRSRLGQELNSLRVETQNRVGTLKSELAALLESPQSLKAKTIDSLEQICQNETLQSQMFQARIERLFQGLEEELEMQEASRLTFSSSFSSIQPGDSLQGEFSVKLSALIQDILHSMQ